MAIKVTCRAGDGVTGISGIQPTGRSIEQRRTAESPLRRGLQVQLHDTEAGVQESMPTFVTCSYQTENGMP